VSTCCLPANTSPCNSDDDCCAGNTCNMGTHVCMLK
jgi:hypothetical protein